jgi:hypothetical protein
MVNPPTSTSNTLTAYNGNTIYFTHQYTNTGVTGTDYIGDSGSKDGPFFINLANIYLRFSSAICN